MASSSVSQEDVENDFEKLEKRSRIRTARARQINPQGCRVEASCPGPLTLDIDTDMSELHLEPVTISPYTLPGAGAGAGELPGGGAAADTSPKGREVMAERERGNRKDSVRDPRGDRERGGHSGHQNKVSHHGIKGKQQRDRRKLREKRRSTGVVHLASTESTGGSTSGEEELSECDMAALSSETKRNTQQNESVGESAGHGGGGGGGGSVADTEDTAPESSERKNSGRGPHNSNSHNRSRLRSKNVARSEDMEADDELGDKTDNDHERISPNSTMPSLSSVPGPAAGAVAESGGAEQAAPGDLVKQLQEKDRRIQYLELKIQQLSQDSATILAEHEKLKQENSLLVAAMKKSGTD